MVIGHCVKLSPENTTNPILSFGRSLINCIATFFAASNLSGSKSLANIEPEISNDNTISMPCVDISFSDKELCGRASAVTKNIKDKIFSIGNAASNFTFSEEFCSKTPPCCGILKDG